MRDSFAIFSTGVFILSSIYSLQLSDIALLPGVYFLHWRPYLFGGQRQFAGEPTFACDWRGAPHRSWTTVPRSSVNRYPHTSPLGTREGRTDCSHCCWHYRYVDIAVVWTPFFPRSVSVGCAFWRDHILSAVFRSRCHHGTCRSPQWAWLPIPHNLTRPVVAVARRAPTRLMIVDRGSNTRWITGADV